jgi:hypothetical protein
MFTSKFVRMHVARAALRTEELKKDERFPVFAVGLVVEPLTRELALELGAEVAEHCFTRQGKVREQMTRVVTRVREKPQSITAHMAEDSPEPSAVLRHVRITSLTVTKRGVEADQKEARKGKKIAPQAVTLRATVTCLVDPAEKVHREFLCGFINDTFLFSFEPEQKDLFADMRAEAGDDADDDDDDQVALEFLGNAADPAAGDVLDDQKRADKKKPRGPKLVRGKGDSAGPVH